MALTCSRIVLIAFNVVFFAFGLALLGIGIYSRVQSSAVDDYLRVIDRNDNIFENFGSICIVVGVFCSLLGFTGLFGAIKDHRGCLVFFVVLVGLVFILELVAGGLAYGFHNKIEDTIRDGMFRTIGQYNDQTDNALTKSWDSIQQDQQCCGVVSSVDWFNSTANFNSTSTYLVPDSCLCRDTNNCTKSTPSTPLGSPFGRGCFTEVDERVLKNWKAWGGAAIGFAVIELIGIVFGVLAIRGTNKGYTIA